eukprot:scaffold2828_cov126-Cylindrotheca_fusiformis.AAC.2
MVRSRSVVQTIVVFLVVASAWAQEGTEEQATKEGASPSADESIPVKEDSFNPKDHTDWGSYYDPQNIFCGKYDCYSILGFDYEEFGSNRPSTKEITKRYRSLSRAWHPDKSKHKDAKERFVKIARAYEVLTDNQQRTEYDFMRYNQEAYFQKYGASVLWHYAPQSDASIIVIVLLMAINWFTWVAQKTRWQNVADRLVKAAVEDWSPSMGGSEESKLLREEALEILKEREAASDTREAITNTDKKSGKGKVKKAKVTGKEKKKQEQEALRPIVTELVNKIDDFGAGFHKPTWADLFFVKLAKFPYHFATGVVWQTKYAIRRLQKKELNDEERSVLTERAVGNVTWDLASEEEREAMIKRELWIMDNLVEWKDEQEFKKLSKAEQKYYNKMKKRGVSKDHME